ncbi:MAG: hypothetical protein ACI4ET_10245 [Bilifractor sp.]
MKKIINHTRFCRIMICILLSSALLFLPPCRMTAFADAEHSDVAGSGETASSKAVGRYGMTPISAENVKDGTYDIDVDVSSSFFRIDDCKLTVKNGEMTAVIELDTFSYSLIFNGTAKEAAAADASDYIEIEEDDAGYASFTLPVAALDQQISIASYSVKKKKWYNRTILFDATSLPEDSLLVKLPDFDAIENGLKAEGYDVDTLDASNDLSGANGSTSGTTGTEQGSTESVSSSSASSVVSSSGAASGKAQTGLVESKNATGVDKPDGEYSIEVNMTGGSGRASVTSPTLLVVKNGRAYAKLYWSSTYYDYMIVDGVKYLNNTTDGGTSTFVIPITAMDEAVPVIADTTAMGDPVEIQYQLTFYQDTIGSRNLVPQIATRRVLIIALIIILAGAVLSFLTRKHRYR